MQLLLCFSVSFESNLIQCIMNICFSRKKKCRVSGYPHDSLKQRDFNVILPLRRAQAGLLFSTMKRSLSSCSGAKEVVDILNQAARAVYIIILPLTLLEQGTFWMMKYFINRTLFTAFHQSLKNNYRVNRLQMG